jgi:hypothetical protein
MVLKKRERIQENVLMKTKILSIISFADNQVIVKNAEENMQRAILKLSKRGTRSGALCEFIHRS